MRVAPSIILTDEQKNELARLSRSGRTSVRLAERSRIVLLAAQGLQNKEIAEQLGIGRVQVARWRQRYLESGIEGIERDLPRGAPPVKADVKQLVELTTQSKPDAATHWSMVGDNYLGRSCCLTKECYPDSGCRWPLSLAMG